MSRVRTALVYLQRTSPRPALILGELAMWLGAAAGSNLETPTVNEDPFASPSPLENLGLAGTAIALSVGLLLLRPPLPWVEATSPRHHALLRTSRLCWLLAVTCLGLSMTEPIVSRLTVTVSLRVSATITLLTVSMVALVILGHRLAPLTAPLVVLACSVRGLVPWELSLFNPDAVASAAPGSTVVLIAACAWWVWRGDRHPDVV